MKVSKRSAKTLGHKAGNVQIGRAIRGLMRIRKRGTRYMKLPTLLGTVRKLVAQPQAL
jgi:hypothetical protein